MAQVSIDQTPLYKVLPIGQQLMFSVSESTTVATKFKVKFVAEVYVSNTGITYGASELIGTFKTTPNNAGVGMFNFRPVLESFVSPDNEPSSRAEYKGVDFMVTEFPIHLIDKFSQSDRAIKFFAIRFFVEFATSATDAVGAPTHQVDSAEYTFFNGVLQYDDVLTLDNKNYGYDLQEAGLYTARATGKFLSNAPTTQYANVDDYGAFAFLNFMPIATDSYAIEEIKFEYYSSAGIQYGVSEVITSPINTLTKSEFELMYAGVFPGNLRGWSSTFRAFILAHPDGYYTIKSTNFGGSISSSTYTINLNCPTNLGYTPIRLTWLNQWGVWDYYTFTQKSTKSISTKRAPYNQISGTWNEETLGISGYQGGRKNRITH